MDLFCKNLKYTTPLTVAISMARDVSFAFHQKYGKIKISDTVIKNIGKISNSKKPTSRDDQWTIYVNF